MLPKKFKLPKFCGGCGWRGSCGLIKLESSILSPPPPPPPTFYFPPPWLRRGYCQSKPQRIHTRFTFKKYQPVRFVVKCCNINFVVQFMSTRKKDDENRLIRHWLFVILVYLRNLLVIHSLENCLCLWFAQADEDGFQRN